MDVVSLFLADHAPLALALAFLAHLIKPEVVAALRKDASNKKPGDLAALAEEGVANVIDKVPDPLEIVSKK